MFRLVLVLVLAALAGACSRRASDNSDPALVSNPAPLTDCGEEAFIRILGGGRATVCRGADTDPQTRACVEAANAKPEPYAHVFEVPGGSMVTVRTPERKVFQVRRPTAGPDRVDLVACQGLPTMPPDAMPYMCKAGSAETAPVARGKACQVLERARTLRREQAARK